MHFALGLLPGRAAALWLLAAVCSAGFAEQATSAEERPVRTRHEIEADAAPKPSREQLLARRAGK